MEKESHEFNWVACFFAIITTIGLIVGICNFDLDNILLCCICLLPVALFDFVLIKECILEIKYIYIKNKKIYSIYNKYTYLYVYICNIRPFMV